jgi:hypothetical protein
LSCDAPFLCRKTFSPARRAPANGLCPLCIITRACAHGKRREAATSARNAPFSVPQHVQSLSQGKNNQRKCPLESSESRGPTGVVCNRWARRCHLRAVLGALCGSALCQHANRLVSLPPCCANGKRGRRTWDAVVLCNRRGASRAPHTRIPVQTNGVGVSIRLRRANTVRPYCPPKRPHPSFSL